MNFHFTTPPLENLLVDRPLGPIFRLCAYIFPFCNSLFYCFIELPTKAWKKQPARMYFPEMTGSLMWHLRKMQQQMDPY